ncbi:MAG: EamA family transporter [Defluviitaleaceae bacterium]|nr:EamA family transporter [Defluviitaleaceae bacterium]
MELWLLYAIGAAAFAALTTILAKIGIRDVDSHLATAVRTMVVLVFAWIMVFIVGAQSGIFYISGRTWVFLILSGLATGGSWLCFFRALQLGDVNKVVPIDKSSTILTMILAFIFLREPVGIITVIGMILMGIGTWLMLESRSGFLPTRPWWEYRLEPFKTGWLFYALLAAVFASLVAIFGKIGVVDIDASLWTAIRTVVVVPLSWTMVFLTGSHKKISSVKRISWVFLMLSGVATGASWLFFYHALQIGNASHVVPIDKLSIVLTMGFAWLFLREKFSKRSVAGLGLLTIGTLLPIIL